MSDVNVKGLKELNSFLQQLPAKMEANVLRGALRAGAQPVAEQARQNVRKKTGKLRDGIKVRTGRRGARVTASIRVAGEHAFIGYWLEFTGAAAHVIKAGKGALRFLGISRGSVQHPGFAPKPFLRPALEARAPDAVVAAANYTKKRLATKHGLDAAADVEIEAQ